MSTHSPEIIINSMDGWPPVTRLYKIGTDYYIVSVVDVIAVLDAVSEAIQPFTLPAPVVKPTGNTVIYAAEVETIPIMSWVVNEGVTDPQSLDDAHQEQTGVHYNVTPIDSDGNPLNGLTPLHVLTHGTTHDEAIAYLQGLTE